MIDYWQPAAALLTRDESSLTDDERSSAEYVLAFFDEMDGLTAHTLAQRWARVARLVDHAARLAGRIPTEGEGLPASHAEWIHAQRGAELNSFQRARLEAIVGWTW